MIEQNLIKDSQKQHAIGKVGSPSGKEATSDQFYFWVDRNALVESTQIIRTSSIIGGQEFRFFALVEQVFRVSDKANITDEWERPMEIGRRSQFQQPRCDLCFCTYLTS